MEDLNGRLNRSSEMNSYQSLFHVQTGICLDYLVLPRGREDSYSSPPPLLPQQHHHQTKSRNQAVQNKQSNKGHPRASSAVTKPMEKDVELASLLECLVCYSIPEGEIFNCDRGHSVCSECSRKLEKCALCASAITKSRNYSVESLVSYFRKYNISLEGKPCRSPFIDYCKFEGCRVTVLRSKMEEHSKNCEFRPVSCIMAQQGQSCRGLKFKFSEYFQHLKSCHEIVGQSDAESNLTGYFVKIDRLFKGMEITTTWLPYYFEFDGKIFLRHASILNRNIHWWIQLIGPDREAKKYIAIITLQSPHKAVMQVQWTIPVHPIRVQRNEIERTKEYASVTTSKLIQYCQLNEEFQDRIATHMWSFNLTLRKVG